MPQFVQEESYQPILRNSLRYLWMKGYRDQECNHLNQWCGTRTRLCLAFDRFKGPKHVFRHTLLTSLYPVYYTDQIKQREVFGLAIAKPTFGHDTSNDQPFTRLFRHSDVEICPVGCLAIYLFAQWMDDAQVPDFQQHRWRRWQGRYLLHSRDSFTMIADSTYKRYVGVALGMAKTEAAAAVINPREQGVGAEEVCGFHYNDNTIATDTPLKSYSLTDDSASEPYKLAANLRLHGEYLVIRDAIIPPLELQRQIFPFIEKLFPDNDDWKIWIDNIMMNRPEYTGRPRNQNNHYPKDVSPVIRFMIVLAHQRKIILQDIVALKLCTKDFLVVGNTTHRIADSPVFSSQAFLRFTHQLQEAIQSKSGRAQAAESSGGPIKTQLSRKDIPLADVVLPIATDHNHLSSSSQLPTPPEDGEIDTTPLNAISPEPAKQTQQLTSNQQNNKQQCLPQELLAIRPTEDDEPDILEIKMSLASMFRYMETESKAVSHFASATFSSLEQLQRQVACVENTAQVLLEKEVAADSKSVERHVPESALYHSPPQQDAGNLEQWLQQQNEIRPWRKGIQQGTGAQHLEQQLSRSAVSVGETRLSGDSETRRGGLLNMNTLRENMSRSKALNQDVNRRISNLEAELLAVGRSLRAVVGVGVTDEWSGAEAQARDEGEEDSGERDEPSDEEEDGHQDESWEPSRTRTRTRTGTRTGSSKAETKKQDEKRTALKSFYPENLVALADQIAALYPQLTEDKVRAIHLPITRSQISLALPTTLKDVWVEHFSAKGSQPSFWSLETYVDAWRSELNELHSATLSRKRVIIAVILKEIGRTKGSSLKAREEKALAALSVTTSKKKSLYHFYNQHSSGGIFRKRLVNKH
ncbi:MAG: hypothetical protein J3R72DRAFT_71686 [Linnemannia gamsii]|nr:MAG: hypothetical protein J3R72DRAFT_71686 [Linnemannia gamsii]